MHYHIILTELCNSECRYCYGKVEFDTGLEKKFHFRENSLELNIDIKKLRSFLEKDPNPVLVFYGGEPLLKSEIITQIIDSLKGMNIKFRMQTNGKLLDKLPIEYLKKIDKMLVSLDGNKERTDFNRGEGTYDKVIENIKKVRIKGYTGEIVARMTLSPLMEGGEVSYDIFYQVMHIFGLGLFDSIHWQIDVGFHKFDFDKEKLEKWIIEYNKNLDKLVNWWAKEFERGKIWEIYPFLGIMDALIFEGSKGRLMCGAGHAGYCITTDGNIVACPIMAHINEVMAGDLSTDPSKLKKFEIKECESCDYLNYCGGRCLFWRMMKMWPKEGDEMICSMIKHLVDELRKKTPKIKELIYKKKVNKEDFQFEKYFGPEIIP